MATNGTSSPELGNSVFLDHINFPVTDHRLAIRFFLEGLGFTRDPYRMVGTGNMWVNVGTQQFHLPIGQPLPFAGEVGLVVPHPAALAKRLGALAADFAGTGFAMEWDDQTLRVNDPWGRRLRIHPAGSLPGRNPLAIPYVTFLVAPGTAQGLADFYRDVVGAPARTVANGGPACATVDVGPWHELRFQESEDEAPSGHALHVCIYVTRFWELYERMRAMGLLMEDVANEQFRFRDMPALTGGEMLYSIEHEVRSIAHNDYRRPLVNRTVMPNEPGFEYTARPPVGL